MTISNQTNRTSAVGNAAIGQEVDFLFPLTSSSDITVMVRVTATGVESTFSETTNYTVTDINGLIDPTADWSSGGTVTTVTAVASTSQIHIIRNTPNTQSLDLVTGGNFNAENIENALDKNTKLTIESNDGLDRTLKFPTTDPASSFSDMPNSVDRASKNLTFDSTGKPTASVVVESGSVTFSAIGTQIAEAANASTERGILELDTVNDVKYFGATGLGVTDDTDAIKLAIADSSKPLYFPDGTYNIDETFEFTTSRQIILSNNTIIKATTNIDEIFLSLTASVNITLLGNGGLLDCNNKAAFGIRVWNANRFVVDNLRCNNYRDKGSNTQNVNSALNEYFQITNCQFDNTTSAPGFGHNILSSDDTTAHIYDCILTNGFNGVRIQGTNTSGIVEICTVDTMGDNGVYFDTDTTDSNCTAVGCNVYNTGEGVVCTENGSTKVLGCNFRGTTNKAVSMRDVNGVIVDGCTFDGDANPVGTRAGSFDDSPTNIVITNNIMDKPTSHGIFLSRANDVVISGNIITDFTNATTKDGIHIAYAGTAALGSTRIDITNNLIFDASTNLRHGIAFNDAEVTGNTARGNRIVGAQSGDYAQLDSASLNVVEPLGNAYLTLTDASEAPSVFGGTKFFTGTTTDTITEFNEGYVGQEITVISKGDITFETDTAGTGKLHCGTVDLVTATGDVTTWICETAATPTTNVWRMKSYMNSYVDNN